MGFFISIPEGRFTSFRPYFPYRNACFKWLNGIAASIFIYGEVPGIKISLEGDFTYKFNEYGDTFLFLRIFGT